MKTVKLLRLIKLNKRTKKITERLKVRWQGYAGIFTLKIIRKITRMKLYSIVILSVAFNWNFINREKCFFKDGWISTILKGTLPYKIPSVNPTFSSLDNAKSICSKV